MRGWTSLLMTSLAGLAPVALAAQGAMAQQTVFPNKQIRMMFGFAPGGSSDMAARRRRYPT